MPGTARRKPSAAPAAGEQHAFAEQLADDPAPAGAHGQPEANFLLPGSRARQEQVGDIRARKQQQQARHDGQGRHERLQHVVQERQVADTEETQPARTVLPF